MEVAQFFSIAQLSSGRSGASRPAASRRDQCERWGEASLGDGGACDHPAPRTLGCNGFQELHMYVESLEVR